MIDHQPRCAARRLRKQFSLAARLIDVTWDAFREETWDDEQPTDIIRSGGQVDFTIPRWTSSNPDRPILRSYECPPGVAADLCKALLNLNACHDALAYTASFIPEILRDFVKDPVHPEPGLEELHFEPRQPAFQLQGTHSVGSIANNTTFLHIVLKVTLRSGEVYVLDLTRWQYGWTDLLVPYHVYRQRMVPAPATEGRDPFMTAFGVTGGRTIVDDNRGGRFGCAPNYFAAVARCSFFAAAALTAPTQTSPAAHALRLLKRYHTVTDQDVAIYRNVVRESVRDAVGRWRSMPMNAGLIAATWQELNPVERTDSSHSLPDLMSLVKERDGSEQGETEGSERQKKTSRNRR